MYVRPMQAYVVHLTVIEFPYRYDKVLLSQQRGHEADDRVDTRSR
jgi:hypothetical protein